MGWDDVASWGADPSGSASLIWATFMPMSKLDRIVVTSDNIEDVLVDARANADT